MPETCGTCKHFVRGEADPRNIGAPVNGECRAIPPGISFVPIASGMGVQMQKMCAYPTVTNVFPACGMHAPAVNGNGHVNRIAEVANG